nr:hypothetical protein [Tanacetum cinerariifolium]
QFTRRQDPHNHLRFFNKVTSTFRHPELPNTTIKLLLFHFSLEGEARIWLDKEPPRSILTWEDLLDTFYNALNPNDQDALDSTARGNLLDKIPRECLSIIESKSKVRYSRNRVTDVRANANAPPSSSHSNYFDLQQIAASLEDKLDIRMNRFKKSLNDMKNSFITPTAPLKAVEEPLEISFKTVKMFLTRCVHRDLISLLIKTTTKTVSKAIISIKIKTVNPTRELSIRIVHSKTLIFKHHHNKTRLHKAKFEAYSIANDATTSAPSPSPLHVTTSAATAAVLITYTSSNTSTESTPSTPPSSPHRHHLYHPHHHQTVTSIRVRWFYKNAAAAFGLY